MTAKEKIVEMLQASGYDLFTACEYADNAISEFKQSELSKMTFHIISNGTIIKSFEIKRGTSNVYN